MPKKKEFGQIESQRDLIEAFKEVKEQDSSTPLEYQVDMANKVIAALNDPLGTLDINKPSKRRVFLEGTKELGIQSLRPMEIPLTTDSMRRGKPHRAKGHFVSFVAVRLRETPEIPSALPGTDLGDEEDYYNKDTVGGLIPNTAVLCLLARTEDRTEGYVERDSERLADFAKVIIFNAKGPGYDTTEPHLRPYVCADDQNAFLFQYMAAPVEVKEKVLGALSDEKLGEISGFVEKENLPNPVFQDFSNKLKERETKNKPVIGPATERLSSLTHRGVSR